MKRVFDLVVSIFVMLLVLPILLIVSIFIFFQLGWPVFFLQIRPGLHAKPFKIIKFRTMSSDVDENGLLLSDVDRLTSLGSFLRSASLDELPELWNVVKGDMSLVGPRPLAMEYISLYSEEQNRRHEVRPGITGWAQVNGRNSISWSQKFALDVWYVDNRSIWLDIKILLMTVRQVLRRKDVMAGGQADVESFNGRN